MSDRLLTPKEVAEWFRWKISTVYAKVHLREIPHLKVGGAIRFRESDLLKWLKERERGNGEGV